MSEQTITVTPIAGALGAEVEGVDLAYVSAETFAAIRQAFLTHHVLMFHDQTLSSEQHLAFAKRFGALDIAPFVKAVAGHPEIIEIVKEPEDTINFGAGWHSDFSFKKEPPLGSLLYALETPPYGGDTMFANLHLAYETLSDGMKAMLDGLVGVHSPRRIYSAAALATRKRA
ncbi:MAG: TauD/TfdA family dioxygenase, partial [Alphaproteobacteria bacterium]|nr:TauD/TfdA family dioxygenase [Alphaproteobacteria bacterium]